MLELAQAIGHFLLAIALLLSAIGHFVWLIP
jgi:hypothetical protein